MDWRKYRPIIMTFIIILLPMAQKVFGHNVSAPKDSVCNVVLYFRVNAFNIDSGYMDNSKALSEIQHIINAYNGTENVRQIKIYATSSPEGNSSYNESLASKRAQSVKDYILSHNSLIAPQQIITQYSDDTWSKLILLVKADMNIPDKVAILEILQHNNNKTEQQLRALNNGTTWAYLCRYILPAQRSATCTMLIASPTNTTETEAQICTDTIKQVEIQYITECNYLCKPLFAVKTNLLFDALTALNVEIEVPIGARWSIAGDWIFPWWRWASDEPTTKRSRFELLYGTLEGRYWFGQRERYNPLTGWYAGVYAGGGLYDLERKRKGYQGEFLTAGVSGGYAHTINKSGSLRMEYGLSLGYMRTHYRHYEAEYGADELWHAIRQNDGHYTWVGPTKLKVSLVWMLNHHVKKGGKK
ncbi:MAG: DUF3575 domain-containing protein [Marinifilaceae bacterium]